MFFLLLVACGDDGSGSEGTTAGSGGSSTSQEPTGVGSADDGDGPTSGSASGSASGSMGADGGTANDGSSGPGTPTGGELDACPPDAAAVMECPELGVLCQSGPLCCRCIDFEEPSCGLLWDCAQTDNNGAECPAEPPMDGETCDTLNLSCTYCEADGPRFFHCGMVNPGTEPPYVWTESDSAITCSS